MNKILNWTFGSVFRTIGRVFAYLLIGALFALIMSKSGLKITDLIGIDTIKAAEVNTNYEKYSVRMYSTETLSEQWSSFMDTGSNFTTQDSDLYLRAFRVRFGSNDKFLKGKTYRVKVNVLLNNGNSSKYKNINNVLCYGSTTNSFDMNTGFIDTCQFIAKTLYEDNTRAHYYFDIKPNTDLYSIQVQFYYSDSSMYQLNMTSVSPLQVGTGTNATYDDSDITAINNQTTDLINNNNQNTQDIINNNNENTQNIINSQNELMGNKCENLLNIKDITDNLTFDSSGNTFTATDYFITNNFLEVDSNTSYIFNKTGGIRIVEYNSSKGFIQRSFVDRNFTTKSNTKYIKISALKSAKNEFMLNKGTTSKSYCEYGSYSSKLDDTNQSINNLNDNLMNDTINNSDINVNYNLQDNAYGPFGTFLNLPLTWVSNILASGQTCTTIRIPLPYLNNKTLDLPCMSGFWNSLGALGSLIQAFWLAVVGIKIFNGLFLLVVDTTSSKDNVDELTKLQTWEL